MTFLFLTLSFWGYSQNTWHLKGTMPGTSRVEAISFSIGNEAYYGTGFGSNSTPLSDMWKYNPNTNNWSQLHNFPTPLYGATAFVINDTAYVTNGRKTTGGNYNSFVYRYDALLDTFIITSTYPGTPAYTTCSFTANSKAYIGIGFPLTNEIWEFNPSTNTWASKASFPGTQRQNASAFGINGLGFIGGGAYDPVIAYDDLWSYNPITNMWDSLTTIPGGGRFAALEFTLNNKIYIGCGNNYIAYLKDLWSYDTFSNIWTQEDDFGGVARYSTSAFSIGNTAYAGSGKAIGFLNDYWEFSQSTGLENISNGSNIFLNPTSDILFIKGINPIQSVSIFNSLGQLESNYKGQNLAQVNTSNLKKGIYFVKVIDSNYHSDTFKIMLSK